MKDLTKGNPTRLMLSFALPVCLGNIFQLFYSLADTRIVGSTLGNEALAAIAANNGNHYFINWFLQDYQWIFLSSHSALQQNRATS